ncbi:MAG: cytochrome c [Holophagaceae bacterium]|nr:cytochrome c [Holophagaceae bacterium]
MISRAAALLLLAFSRMPLTAEVRDLKAFFQERCAVCHGPDGSGRGANGARLGGRNLAEARWLAKQEESELVAAILKGRGAMPGFRRQLSEAEARRLLVEIIRPLATRKRS